MSGLLQNRFPYPNRSIAPTLRSGTQPEVGLYIKQSNPISFEILTIEQNTATTHLIAMSENAKLSEKQLP